MNNRFLSQKIEARFSATFFILKSKQADDASFDIYFYYF